jgi:hypothetical protein
MVNKCSVLFATMYQILSLQIMDALLLGCRDEDEDVQLACADCIGAVGAVDPGHLSWRELQSGMFFISMLYCKIL